MQRGFKGKIILSLKLFFKERRRNVAKKKKDMPSGINVMGMGGTGEELNQAVSAPKNKVSGKKLMKSNAQSS